MSAQPRPASDLLIASFGPIVWAAHFAALYLTEAFLCSPPEPATGAQIRWIGAALTLFALAALIAFAARSRYVLWYPDDKRTGSGALSAFAGPLAILSILAILWTTFPLFLLPACAPGGG